MRLFKLGAALLAFALIGTSIAFSKSVEQKDSDESDRSSRLKQANELFVKTHQLTKDKSLVEQISIVENLSKQHENDFFVFSMLTQDLSWRYSRAGLHHKAIKAMDATFGQDKGEISQLKDYVAKPAVPMLLELAGDYHIVMVNEAHHNAQHRVLTYRLLDELWAKGFRFFAAEALTPECEQELNKGYVTANCGLYPQEPIFANLIGKALDMGFKVLSYDSDLPNITNTTNERETNAASVIQRKVFLENPNAKVIIHVGFAHINEKDWLAAKLTKTTGLETLTINQTSYIERSRQGLESPIYQYVAQKSFGEPMVLAKGSELWCAQDKACDVSVFWPRTRLVNGRPEWAGLGRQSIELDSTACKSKAPCLVEVFSQYQLDETPTDRIILNGNSEPTSVFVQPGTNTIVVTGADGTQLSVEKREVI
ncbi:hypothetical protein [Paraferrimonas sedimenticola]|uniref:Haem-binding uptake Tiki superfamily ChaN domain-containing protein n=1 Tax=Paraferrimonas sedimenticola TaxID=375674 RepID=A0AA37W054_9GAMM|nr:hypothetical protein [Paraferrimonas sedimenticola]GLP98036.1 hypothetical protein GCM10007895_33430 [Paraferrimonas sedimenticola]